MNDLLNQKDDEIARLSQKVLQLEEDRHSRSPARSSNVRKGVTPSKSPRNLTQAHGTVTDLENKLIDMQRENKDLQKEIKLLQRIQDRQGNALELMNQDGYTEK